MNGATQAPSTAFEKLRLAIDARRRASEPVTSDALVDLITEFIVDIDHKLAQVLNLILHHDRFQQLEGAWRGLHYLVGHTETRVDLKIRVFDVSKADLMQDLTRPDNGWVQSAIFKRIYEWEFGVLGGEPYGCLIGDYYFDHTAPDVDLLQGLAHLAAACHAPFIAAAAPRLMGIGSWRELDSLKDLGSVIGAPDRVGWRSLRESAEARYVGLVLPRALARPPYARAVSVDEFTITESTETVADVTWMNPAYVVAVNINRAFGNHAWCAAIAGVDSGGVVDGLPVHSFPTDVTGVHEASPLETTLTDRNQAQLAHSGLTLLFYGNSTNQVVCFDAPSLQKPVTYNDDEATQNARCGAKLPYLFAASRFAQYVLIIERDRIGSFMEREDIERRLAGWLQKYVLAEPSSATDELRASKPLLDAKLTLQEIQGALGCYAAKLMVRPHYQLPVPASIRVQLFLRTSGYDSVFVPPPYKMPERPPQQTWSSPPKEIGTLAPRQARTPPSIIPPATATRPWWPRAIANIRAWLGRRS
jgi:type VI secretion system protein ImpC